MRLYLDDDCVAAALIRHLRRDRHDVMVPTDVGMAGEKDHVHLSFAIRQQRAVLTYNYRDFDSLHDLVVIAAQGHHYGILVVRRDADPRHTMSVPDICRAIRNLENAGVPIANECHSLNHWQ